MARPPHRLEQQRRVVARHLRRQGLSYSQLAAVLGMPIMSTWELVQRAGDTAPPRARRRDGRTYATRHRPPPDLPAVHDCPACQPVDAQHDPACPGAGAAQLDPDRAARSRSGLAPPRPNTGGAGRGRTGPETWATIVDKVRAGSSHAQVAREFGVSRPRVTWIVARARGGGS